MLLRFEVFNKYAEKQSFLKKKVFLFASDTDFEEEHLIRIKKILHNPVLQEIKLYHEGQIKDEAFVDIFFLPSMTDNVAQSILSALTISGLHFVNLKVHTATSFQFLTNEKLEAFHPPGYNPLLHFLKKQGCNSAIHFPEDFLQEQSAKARYEHIEFEELHDWASKRLLALTHEEIKIIAEYYKTKLGRKPTDVEIEILAQTWSEHCKHKIFAADYEYISESKNGKQIPSKKIQSLFSTYIKSTVTDEREDCVSVFHDNAGVVRWDPNVDLCIKVETHNSPSALDPFSGAITGVLGVQRDIMGTGRGAKAIANMDVFCVGDLEDFPEEDSEERPEKILHPKHILVGVHKGVEEGGNKMGIPTINGSFQFHPNFAGKPLIYVGSLGIMPREVAGEECVNKEIRVGDHIFVGGGRLGRDGIHGATFSSLSMEGEIPPSVVQLGDPITQKKLLDFSLRARDLGYIRGLTDNGAGGISSSVGELAQYTDGACIDIAKHPLKYEGLDCYEMVISESQERMTYAVPPEHKNDFLNLAKIYDVELSHLGDFCSHGFFEVRHGDEVIAKIPLDLLHEKCPKMNLTARWQGPTAPKYWYRKRPYREASEWKAVALTLLASPNICSKESWVRSYDHEVQGATIGKPFQGRSRQAPSNGGIIDLEMHGGTKNTAVALAHGFAAKISHLDTYLMAQLAIDECVRNLIASGANPKKIALLDNFCWPNPFLPDNSEQRLAQLVRACEAIYDMAKMYGMPFISGKDSMKNSFQGRNRAGRNVAIDVEPSLLITGIGHIERSDSIPASSFKKSSTRVYAVGLKPQNLIGSEFSYFFKTADKLEIPTYDFMLAMQVHTRLAEAIRAEYIDAVHDVSDGGLLLAILEMTLGYNIGIEIERDLTHLEAFGEGPCQYVVSVTEERANLFENEMTGLPLTYLGRTSAQPNVSFNNNNISVDEILQAWSNPLC